MHSRKQYLLELRKEYEQADMGARGRLLDEAQKRTGLNRKYLIRTLNGPLRPVAVRRSRRSRKYGVAVGPASAPPRAAPAPPSPPRPPPPSPRPPPPPPP